MACAVESSGAMHGEYISFFLAGNFSGRFFYRFEEQKLFFCRIFETKEKFLLYFFYSLHIITAAYCYKSIG